MPLNFILYNNQFSDLALKNSFQKYNILYLGVAVQGGR
jgi:hypothetical protein